MKRLIGVLVLLLPIAACAQIGIKGRSGATGQSGLNSSSNAHVNSVTVTPANQQQFVNSTVGFTATANLSNGQHINVTKFSLWTVNNGTVATLASLTDTENILCISGGTIEVKALYGSVSGTTHLTCNPTVPPPPTLVSASVTPSAPHVNVGQGQGFTVMGTFSDGSSQNLTSGPNTVWSSSDTTKATLGTLSTTQLVNCIAAGPSNITATIGAVSNSATITCVAVLSSIAVTPASPKLLIGGSIGMIATGTYSDASKQDVTQSCNPWASSATGVGQLGALTTVQTVNAVGAGTSTLSCTIGAISGTTVLTVTSPGPGPPTLSSILVTPTNPTVNIPGTLGFVATAVYSDSSTQNVTGLAAWASSNSARATVLLPDGVVGSPYNFTLSGTGPTPYQWTVPAGTAGGGQVDFLDWAAMPLPDRSNFHLSGNAVKYFRIDAGLLSWIKSASGGPADGELYDANCVRQWYTEGPTFSNLSGYKKYRNPPCLWPRYHTPGAHDQIDTPGPNLYDITESCGADNLSPIDNLDIRGTLDGPFTDVNFGGSIGTAAYLLATKFIKGTAGVYQTREQYWAVQGFGQAKWCTSHWNGSTYIVDQCSLDNNKVAGGAPALNFACGIPNPPLTGTLPPGTIQTTSPSLNLPSSTGVIQGTPRQTGVYPITIQQEDSTSAFHLQPQQITVDPAGSIPQRSIKCNTAGAVTLSATFQSVTGNATVTCQTPAPTLSTITVLPANPTGNTNGNVNFTAKGIYSDGSTQDLTSQVTWSSSATAVAIIGVTANPQPVTCLAPGPATIQAQLGAVSGTTTLTCQAPTPPNIGIDGYCGPGNVPSFGSSDGPALLPTTCYYTNPSARPTTGTVRTATAGTWNAQWALTNCDDVVEIAAGGLLSGSFSIPSMNCAAGHYRTLRVTNFNSSFPAYGTRVSPCFWGVGSLVGYPSFNCVSTTNVGATIQSTGTSIPLTLVGPIDGLQIEGVKIARTSGTGFIAQLINLSGSGFDHIILDRSWCAGSPTVTDDGTRCINISSVNDFASLNSLFTEFHCQSNGSCSDAQGILDGEDNTGVAKHTRKIVGNFGTASGQGIYFSGGGPANTTPTDLEYRLNWPFKPPCWNPADPCFQGGTPYQVKNNLEFKNFDKALVEASVLEGTWDGFSQNGSQILITPKNQSGSQCPLCQVTNITIRYILSHTSNYAIQVANVSPLGIAGNSYSFHDAIFDNLGYATCFSCSTDLGNAIDGGFYTQPNAPASDVLNNATYNHNTFVLASGAPSRSGTIGISGPLISTGNPMTNYTYTNNLTIKGVQSNGNANPLDSCGATPVTNCACNQTTPTAVLNACFAHYTFGGNTILNTGNVIWPGPTCTAETSYANIFVNYNAGLNTNVLNYQVKTSSPCHNSALDGLDPGADVQTLANRIQGVANF